MEVTEEQYKEAQKIVNAWHEQERKIRQEKLDNLASDLRDYFSKNKVLGVYVKLEYLRESISHGRLYDIIIDPSFEEYYDGRNDNDIEKIANKHGISASFPYWMYPK